MVIVAVAAAGSVTMSIVGVAVRTDSQRLQTNSLQSPQQYRLTSPLSPDEFPKNSYDLPDNYPLIPYELHTMFGGRPGNFPKNIALILH